jgi:RTX calcium-binding nonapeptide repeat (4 copies)
MKRLVLLAAALAVSLAVPSPAHAAPNKSTETAGVAGGVLTATSGTNTVDTLALSSGFGGVIVSETTSPSGTLGTGCSALTTTSAYCVGASSASIQALDLNDSIQNGSTLPATLDGGTGDDTITGGDPSEAVLGGDGNDVLNAGGGQDRVDGGAGDDRIDARDGLVDVVDCGIGTDTVVADRGDAVTNCEDVSFPPLTGTTGGGTTQTTTPGSSGTDGSADEGPLSAPELLAPVSVAGPVTAGVAPGAEISVTADGLAPFLLGCSADEARACTGSIFIDSAPAAKRSSRKKAKKASVTAFMARRGRYGHTPFKIRPGSEDKVDVTLTGIALKALGKPRGRRARSARRGRRVRAVVTIAPKRARAQRVTIVLKG